MTEHEYDGDRWVRSVTTREPLFTEQDRAELLALALYRDGLCPACGGPIDECTAPETAGPRFKATRILCQRRDALSMAQAALEDTGRPEANVWFTTQIRR